MGSQKTREETNLQNWRLASKHEDKGIRSRIWKVSPMLLALNSLNLSAQSPPCNRKALPRAVSSSLSSKLLASPANTDGGELYSVFRTTFQCLQLSVCWLLQSCLGFPTVQRPTALSSNSSMPELRRSSHADKVGLKPLVVFFV